MKLLLNQVLRHGSYASIEISFHEAVTRRRYPYVKLSRQETICLRIHPAKEAIPLSRRPSLKPSLN